MQKSHFIFGIIRENVGYSAINIEDTSYMTAADTWEELLTNIQDILELLENIPHKIEKETDFSQYCCYIIVEYEKGNEKVKVLKKITELQNLDEYKPVSS